MSYSKMDLVTNIVQCCKCLNYDNIYFNDIHITLFREKYENQWPKLKDAKVIFYSLENTEILIVECYDVVYHNNDYKNEYKFSINIPLSEIDIKILKSINDNLFDRCRILEKENIIKMLVIEKLKTEYKIYKY